MRPSLLFALLMLSGLPGAAQADDTIVQNLRYENAIYRENISTVLFYPHADPLAFPAIPLRGGSVELHFDDLDADHKNFSYTLIHCNADWTPSSLTKNEYIEGYQEFFLNNYEFSFNTFYPYTHYRLSIPNRDMAVTKSGNYLLVIAENNDWEHPVITRRLMVYEDFVQAGIEVLRPTVLDYRDTHHEVDLILNHTGYEIPNPFQDLRVVLLQNQRWDNAITNLKPQFVRDYQLLYNYERGNLFPGGNEFRFFDLKTVQALGQNVRKIERDSLFTAYLAEESSRVIQRYSTIPDINGQRVIRRLNSDVPDAEADYVWVDFYINYPWPLDNGNLYIFGALSDWSADPRFKMHYRYDLKGYTARILLKQGYYNYAYAVQEKPGGPLDVEPMEANHWETENDYQLLIYHREIGIRYDRLVGFSQASSDQLY